MKSSPHRADNPPAAEPAPGRAAAASLPRPFVWAVAVACAMPLLLALIDPGPAVQSLVGDVPAAAELTDAMHEAMAGSLVHALLEWSAFCTALLTAVLAYNHYRITGDVTTPVIGMALLTAGCMDAFHALASLRLIGGAAPLEHLVPFTWTLSQTFAAAILVTGVGLLLIYRRESLEGHRFVLGAGLGFTVLACVVVQVCATSIRLPRTLFPEQFVARPYDLVPLALLAFVAVPLVSIFHRRHRSPFSRALLISLVPQIAALAFMSFGSAALYDPAFNVAHGLKIVAYGVLLAGLVLEYERAYRAHVETERALRLSQERFDLAVRGTTDGLWDWDIQTNEVWFAPRFKELLGYRDDEFANDMASLKSHLHPDDDHWMWKAIDDHLERGDPFDVEYRLRTRTGDYRWFRARAIAVRNEHGRPVRMAGSIQDVTEWKEVIGHLESLSERLAQDNTRIAVDARIDGLTRVLNRASWEEGVSIEDERSRRHGHAYSVMMIDIDGFKDFNDTAGHFAGDDCLRAVADCVCRTCRVTDVVGRYGGDEFVVLLPETDLPSGRRAAERVLETIDSRAIRHPGPGADGALTVSIGVAEGPSPDGWRTVLGRADQALYRAKAGGKNRIAMSDHREAA
jgi:diguanylate cyclase (GGDEF)-like protein/PAS domain S-box-containing protein